MQSGYDIKHLVQEAQTRWLKPAEVYFILQNYEENQITHQIPQKPTSGSLYLFNKRELKFFRKDGHSWRKRRDQRTTAEAHERLKVGNAEALNCYYAHGEENHNFQRRIFWMLDPSYEHIVLVHYRDICEVKSCQGVTIGMAEGTQKPRSTSQLPTLSPYICPSATSFAFELPDSLFVLGESYNNESTPSSVEVNSNQVVINCVMNQSEERTNEVSSSAEPDLSQALHRIKQQLSLNDDEVTVHNGYYFENGHSNDIDLLREYELFGLTANSTDNVLPLQSDEEAQQQHQLPSTEVDIWKELLDSPNNLPNVESPTQRRHASVSVLHELNPLYQTYSPIPHAYENPTNCNSPLIHQDGLGISLENNRSLTIAQKKFTIREISPEWCYTSESTKIIIIGSFNCDSSECEWACMIGDIEVPVQIIQEGVLCCYAPPHLQGKVHICITSGNREACSEVRDFEYRAKSNICTHSYLPGTEAYKNPDELKSLVRFTQMLLSDEEQKGDVSESRNDISRKSTTSEDSWSEFIDELLVGSSTLSSTLDWLLQELLKDKLEVWLSSKLQNNHEKGCSLSKKEQGIIHMVAILGFEWALQPILNSGISVNFRDSNGWTALHWAARFGREKMVAALIASGASAGAVTDPKAEDPNGKTPASLAATFGHKGLAGYLSEVSLTSHLSSLTLEESELSKERAALEAEETVYSISNQSSSEFDDQDSLRQTMAAVRNAAQAAARIQSAFRAHSFQKRQQQKGALMTFAAASGDEYSFLENDIPGISAASKLAFRSTRDYNSAALSIQKNYRSWKGRKDFLSLRQKVVMIQAHVRGYQVRKDYRICWAVGILEKVILRWRRRGVGLRGFWVDLESIDESEDEDILRVFRKQKVESAIDEAVSRVLSMVESPVARQQYHRLLCRYRQAKAELGKNESAAASSHRRDIAPDNAIFTMENDETYQIT